MTKYTFHASYTKTAVILRAALRQAALIAGAEGSREVIMQNGKRYYLLAAPLLLCGTLFGIWYTFEKNGSGIYYLLSMLTLFTTLAVAYRYGASSGGVCGTACGIVMALLGADTSYLGIYCIMGFLAGLFSALGKLGCAVAYLAGALGCGVLISSGWLYGTLYEIVASTVFFFVVPIAKQGRTAARLPLSRRAGVEMDAKEAVRYGNACSHYMSNAASVKFEHFEQAFRVLADSMLQVPAGVRMRTAGIQGEELVWRNRYLENCSILASQYQEISGALKRMKEEMKEGTVPDEETAEVLAGQLEKRRLKLHRAIFYENEENRQELYITVAAIEGEVIGVQEVCSAVTRALGEAWRNAPDSVRIITGNPVTIHMETKEELMVLHGTARCIKEGSPQSGDSFSAIRLPYQKYLLALCDGAGSGQAAATQSREVLDMTERLIEAGFEPCNVMKTVQSSLLLGYSQYPVSIDVGIVDLLSGEVHFLKCGAAASFIKQGKRVRIVEGASLPMGVVMDAVPEESVEQAGRDAYVIMVTDGILEGIDGYHKEERLRDFLCHYEEENPRQMAADILEFASGGAGGAADDCSVLVGLIARNTLRG